jgi:hypothetical protein
VSVLEPFVWVVVVFLLVLAYKVAGYYGLDRFAFPLTGMRQNRQHGVSAHRSPTQLHKRI